jgi:signal transduction histidine kinase
MEIISGRKRCMVYITYKGKIKYCYLINLIGRNYCEVLDADGDILLKLILKKQSGRAVNEFNWPAETGPSDGILGE